MEVRDIEYWRERSCNDCTSRNEVKELVIGENGASAVVALCKECRKKLYEILGEVE